MYEAVTTRPQGESTVARMALTAADFGYDGIVVRNTGDQLPSFDGSIAGEYDVDVVEGVEITADDPSRASGFLGQHRPHKTIVAVRGGTTPLNRFAVEHAAVDVLSQPFGQDGSGDVDHVLAKAAAENGVRIEFSLKSLLTETGGSRVRAIQSLRKLGRLVEKYDAPYVVTAGSDSHLGLRGPRELTALGSVVDLSPAAVEEGLTEWGRLADRNRERHSSKFIEPGVRRYEDE